MADPVINPGVAGSEFIWTPSYEDNFDIADGPLIGRSNTFINIDMETDGGLHNVGNSGLNADGTVNPGGKVDGKRWSAWYNDHIDQCAYIKNQELLMGGFAVNAPDPTRIPYTDNGMQVRYDQWRFYLPFLTTWDRDYSNAANGGAGGHIEAANSPGLFWNRGTVLEFRASFEDVRAMACRWSSYLLPVQYDEINLAYNSNPGTGEVDKPEFDWSQPEFLQCKVIGGAAGQTPNGSINIMAGFGINPSVGYHTYTFVWLDDKMVWLIDGIEVQRDTVRVFDHPHYMVWSREMNSGIKETDAHYDELYAPKDVGIWGTQFWNDRDRFISPVGDGDVARLSYFRAWTIGGDMPPPAPALAGRVKGSPIGSIQQRIERWWEAEDPNFDYDAYTYEWISPSANITFMHPSSRFTVMEFTGTITQDLLAQITCRVLPK